VSVIRTEDSGVWLDSTKGAVAYFSTLGLALALGLAMMSPVFGYVLTRPGGESNILIVLLSVPVILLWTTLVIRGQWLHAVGMQILLLNVTARASELAGIIEYTNFDGINETASATTVLIVVAALGAALRAKRPVVSGRAGHTGLVLLSIFGVIATVSQFANHSLYSAFWLSITGLWQYVLVGYLVLIAIRRVDDIRILQWYMIFSVMLSALIRLVTRGEYWKLMDGSSPARLGSIAFGPANYYSSTVVLVLMLCVGIFVRLTSPQAKVVCAMALGFLAMEQINTYTRGGYIALALLILLPLWKAQRSFMKRFAVAIGTLTIVVGRWLIPMILFRPIDMNENSVQERLWLILAALPHVFDRFGFGRGIANYVIFEDPTGTNGFQLPVHALLLECAEMVGAWATVALVVFFAYVVVRVWRLSRTDHGVFGHYATYLFLAIMGWHIYANTTGTSILCYAPQEATVLVYATMFMALRLVDLKSEMAETQDGPVAHEEIMDVR
jgi:hypothetical protein